MSREEVFEKLNNVFQDVFDDETIARKEDSVCEGIEQRIY